MVSETDVRSRYTAYVQEIEYLDREMFRLQMRVRLGSEHWRMELEQLANHAERRRALEAQRQALSWVLTPENAMGTGSASAYG
jgi:hypothetical protein